MSMYLQPLAFMEGLGGMEVFLVMVVILVLFGGDKLPEFARGAGKMIREFKKASSGVEEEFKRALEEEDRKKSIVAPLSPPYVPPVTEPIAPALSAPTEQSPSSLLNRLRDRSRRFLPRLMLPPHPRTIPRRRLLLLPAEAPRRPPLRSSRLRHLRCYRVKVTILDSKSRTRHAVGRIR